MPNHVHVCFQEKLGYPLPAVLQSWKGYTARVINLRLNRSGPVWSRDYFDRAVRSELQLRRTIHYIHGNPVKARLVEKPEDWRWSSAWRGRCRWVREEQEGASDGIRAG